MRWLFYILCFLGVVPTTYAQDNVPKKAKQYYENGIEHLRWDRFEEAITELQKAIEKAPDYMEARLQLAHAYGLNNEYEKAYAAIKVIQQMQPELSPEVDYRFSEAAFATQHYTEADSALIRYEAAKVRMSDARKKDAARLRRNVDFAKVAVKDSVSFKPQLLNTTINTPLKEYYPSLTADGKYLYFTRQLADANQINQEDIFVALKDEDGNWGTPLSIGGAVNTPFNEGAHSISADGNTLYFTRCEHDGGYGGCDIYVSYKRGNRWLAAENIGPTINTPAKETQPCISPDGQNLYFVSSRPGGIGSLDIWRSAKEPDGRWGTPENLGPNINTPDIEERPFLHPDNQSLYFSSEGHPGFGNADIFFSKKDANSRWQKPTNLGYPINSFSYEGGIYITTDGSQAYYASGRFEGPGDLDIYTFTVPEKDRPQRATYVTGYVKDGKTGKPLSAIIEFLEPESGKMINRISATESGNFLLTLPLGHDYALNIAQTGYLFYSQNFSLKNTPKGEKYELEVKLQSIAPDEKVTLNNIFFEKDAFALLPASKAELDKIVSFLKANPSLKIEIGGHTDNIGTPAYNQNLSEKRAQSVYNYLLGQHIPAENLSYRGYGETQPVAPNTTDEGRAANRRTELKILSTK